MLSKQKHTSNKRNDTSYNFINQENQENFPTKFGIKVFSQNNSPTCEDKREKMYKKFFRTRKHFKNNQEN